MTLPAHHVECASPTSRYLAGPTTSEDAAMNGTDREHLLARFWAKVNKTDTCWLWTGSINKRGYGRVRRGGKVGRIILAHRYAYEASIGPIPAGLVIDHVCRVKHCVNPSHLEAVPDRVNVARGIGPTAVNARKTHCKRGHEFTLANTGLKLSNGRYCRRCSYEANRARRLANLEAHRAYQREWARKHRRSAS